MPTPQDLERLRGLLRQLGQLGVVRRGELIRAEDWNSLVLAVADIARSVLAADAAVAIPAHEHLDQVGSDWLAPALRELMQRGPLTDPAVQKRLTEIEQTLRRLSEQQDSNNKRVDEFRGRLTDVAARDLERQAAITAVRRAIDGVADPRPQLDSMRASLGVIQRDLSTVQEAASRLSVGGAVVDLGAVLNRVTELEQIRDRLRTANGELLDAATVETRIAEIANRAVTQQQLDDAIRNRPAITAGELGNLETRLATTLREQVNGALTTFRGEVRTELNTQFATIGDLVSTRVNDAMPGLAASLTASLTPRIDTARQTAIQEAVAAAQRALNASTETLRTEVSTQLADLRAGISATVRTEVAQRLTAELGAVRASVDAAAERLDALTAEVSRQNDVQRQHAAAIARVPQDIAALRNELRQTLLVEIDVRITALNRTLDERFFAFERNQNDRFTALSREVLTRAVDEARRAAAELAQNESRSLRTQLLAEMRGIAREEVSISVRDQLRTLVTDSVREQFAAVPGLIASEVRRATATTRPDVLTNVNIRNLPGGGPR